MKHIAEEYRERGKKKTKPQAEKVNGYQQYRKKEHIEIGLNLEEDHHAYHRNKREEKVDHAECNFFYRKDCLVDTDFLDKGSGVDYRSHCIACCVGHKGEKRLSENQINGIVFDLEPKEE